MSTTLGRTGPNKRPHMIGMVASGAAAVVCLVIGIGSLGGSSDMGSTRPAPTSDTVSPTGADHPELDRFIEEQAERDERQQQREAEMDDARSSRSLAPTGSPWGEREYDTSQGSPWGRTTY